jgi:hypothetical protein
VCICARARVAVMWCVYVITDPPPAYTQNTSSLGTLFADFLRFYSMFDFDEQSVSVRRGEPGAVGLRVIVLST